MAESSLLLLVLGQQLSIVGSQILLLGGTTLLECQAVSLALKNLGCDQTLNAGRLGILLCLGTFFFADDLATDLVDILTDIILLAQVKELADVAGTLGTKTAGLGGISNAGNLTLTLLDDGKVEDAELVVDDATADALALALTSTAGDVALGALLEQKADTLVGDDTLGHAEALLVISTSNAEHVALPLSAKGVTLDLSRHALVQEGAESRLCLDLECLLGPVSGI